MDFLIKFLAQLFSSFKLKNPAVAAGILFGLGVLLNGASQGTYYGLFTLPEWGNEAVKYVTMFLLAVTGSQTFQYTNAQSVKTPPITR